MGRKTQTASGKWQELGSAVRVLRRRAGFETAEDLSDRIGVSRPTVWRIEAGETKVKNPVLESICAAVQASEKERAMLFDMAREARSTSRAAVPKDFSLKTKAIIDLEADASEICCATIDLIPAHFQTEAYMRALWAGSGESPLPERVDELARMRLGRQRIFDLDTPPFYRAVIHELALRLPIGGPAVMREQLLHLAEVCEWPNVEIQVQPISAGAYPGIGRTYLLVRFGDDPSRDRVQVDGAGDSFYRDRPASTKPYRLDWDRKRVSALSLRASKQLILDAAEDHGRVGIR